MLICYKDSQQFVRSSEYIQACHLIQGSTSFLSAFQCSTHLHTHSWQIEKYGGWACSNGPHMFFYVHQSHRHDSTHPSLFTSWGALWEPLVCSYDISHSRTWQVSTTSLAATSVSQTVTHPGTNWAQSCLTSVLGLQIVTPCQQGSSPETAFTCPYRKFQWKG